MEGGGPSSNYEGGGGRFSPCPARARAVHTTPIVSADHLAQPKYRLKYMAGILGILAIPSLALWLLGVSGLPLLGVMVGLVVLGLNAALTYGLIEPVGNAIGRILVPSGSSTPPLKGLSHIEAMVARGDLIEAAAAYRQEIETDPADVTSCERLGTLAMRELKDYDLAVWAYREGERRAEPRRKAGFALLVSGIYRDNMQDAGRTMVELGRILRLYPDLPNIAELRAELAQIKAANLEGQ